MAPLAGAAAIDSCWYRALLMLILLVLPPPLPDRPDYHNRYSGVNQCRRTEREGDMCRLGFHCFQNRVTLCAVHKEGR